MSLSLIDLSKVLKRADKSIGVIRVSSNEILRIPVPKAQLLTLENPHPTICLSE